MCTAIYDRGPWRLFGRTLDLEGSYGESVVVTPREFPFSFLREETLSSHAALIGCAHIVKGTPLYYDAVNEWGLSMAALSFPSFAVYRSPREGALNLASFELIPWILGSCRTLDEARECLKTVNLTSDDFSPSLPATPLHWLIADKTGALTIETVADGLKIYENSFGVLANAPVFPFHTTLASFFMHLDASPPANRLAPEVDLPHYSRGMGGLGLPGDLSSPSRFLRAVFGREHTKEEQTLSGAVSRFFHVMDFVAQPRGASRTETGEPIETVYTSCMSQVTGEYFFTTYASRRIRRVSLHDHSLDSDRIVSYQVDEEEQFFTPLKQNKQKSPINEF